MASISLLNPKAEFARAAQALAVNIGAAKGIQDVMKTNLGPKGTMKMWVSFAYASDGNVLRWEFWKSLINTSNTDLINRSQCEKLRIAMKNWLKSIYLPFKPKVSHLT